MTKPSPAIAVLLPSYNPGPELTGTLNSLRVQSMPFRLFLIDDGSKSHTDYEKLTNGMDVQIIRLPKNLGITGAMNAGLAEILKGNFPYIARIDSGDFCTPDRFAKQLDWLETHQDVAILGSAVELHLFNAANELTAKFPLHYPVTPEACRNRLPLNSPASHPTMMIRRSVFERLKGYSEDYPAAEDFDLMWRASTAGFNIANLDDVLLIKEETPGSISQKRRSQQIYSRMRIQWANRNVFSPRCWIGLAKSVITLMTPATVATALKPAMLRTSL